MRKITILLDVLAISTMPISQSTMLAPVTVQAAEATVVKKALYVNTTYEIGKQD